MVQREDPTPDSSAGLARWQRMAQREDPTIELIGLGAMAAQEPNNKISCLSSVQWQRERSNNNFSCLGAMEARESTTKLVGLGAMAANGLAQESNNKINWPRRNGRESLIK